MRYKLITVRILFLLLLPLLLLAQFTYTFDQSIPVEVNGALLKNPWAGGLNSSRRQHHKTRIIFQQCNKTVQYDAMVIDQYYFYLFATCHKG